MKRGSRCALAGWIVYGLACAGWLCVVPYAPERLVEPFPPGTRLITSHRAVSERWDDLASSVLLQDSLAALDTEFAILVRRMGMRDLVLGRIDSSVAGEGPSWVITAWLGGRALAARWWLALRGDSRLTARPASGGRLKWTVDGAEYPADRSLCFTLDEGMLIAVIGHDDGALDRAVAAADGLWPPGFPFEPAWDTSWLLDPDRTDRAWLATRSVDSLRVDVDRLDAGGVAFEVISPVPFTGLPLEPPAGIDPLEALLGPVARTVVLGSGAAWGQLAEVILPTPLEEALAAVSRIQGDEPLLVCLLGGEYGGRVQGLRIPALLAATPIQGGGDAASIVRPLLPEINARVDGGWRLRPVSDESSIRYVFERTDAPPAESRPHDEQFAVAEFGSWVLLTTSRESLDRLVARGEWATTDRAGLPPDWSSLFPPDTGRLNGWADLDRTGKSLRNALAVYMIASMQGTAGNAEEAAARAVTVRGWLQRIQRLGTVNCRMVSNEAGTRIRFEAGPSFAGKDAQ